MIQKTRRGGGEIERSLLQIARVLFELWSLRIDDFRTATPLDCATGLLRMLIWTLAGVAPKSTPVVDSDSPASYKKQDVRLTFKVFPAYFSRFFQIIQVSH